MSDPRPLTLPNGTVHAYACGVCLQIGGGGTVRGNGVNGWTAIPADRSLDYATSCCVCRTCNAPSPHENECDDCRAKWRAQMAALDAERAALAVTSVPGDDAEYYTLTVNGQLLDVAVEDEFGVYTRATIRHRDADDPTRNRDWSESSRCGGFAILQACADAASAFDAETVTLAPKGAVILDAKTAAHMNEPWRDLPDADGLWWMRVGDGEPEPVCVTLVARDEDAQDLYVRRLGVGGVVNLGILRVVAAERPLAWLPLQLPKVPPT